MFDCFVYALSLCAREFPENPKPENPRKSSWNAPRIPLLGACSLSVLKDIISNEELEA